MASQARSSTRPCRSISISRSICVNNTRPSPLPLSQHHLPPRHHPLEVSNSRRAQITALRWAAVQVEVAVLVDTADEHRFVRAVVLSSRR